MKENITKKIVIQSGENAYLVMEKEDEKQIVEQAVKEDIIRDLIYQTSLGQKSLSYAGVLEAARLYKNLDYGISRIDQTVEEYTAYAFCHNLKDNTKITIAKSQSKHEIVKGMKRVDPFAMEKAQSKAIRNAIKGVIPTVFIKNLLVKEFDKIKN